MPGKKTPWDRAARFGTSASGENIFMGSPDGKVANHAWFHSPGHFRTEKGTERKKGRTEKDRVAPGGFPPGATRSFSVPDNLSSPFWDTLQTPSAGFATSVRGRAVVSGASPGLARADVWRGVKTHPRGRGGGEGEKRRRGDGPQANGASLPVSRHKSMGPPSLLRTSF